MYVCVYLCVWEVILGNSSNPIRGLVFDSVVVENPGAKPWGDDFYFCQNDGGVQVVHIFVCALVLYCMIVCMYIHASHIEHTLRVSFC